MFNKIKNFMYRGVHGWCPEDTWCLDWYLSRVIAESTRYLAKTSHGFPDEVGSMKEWKKILKTISTGMMAPVIEEMIDRDKDFLKKAREAYKKQKVALELFVKYFNNLWD